MSEGAEGSQATRKLLMLSSTEFRQTPSSAGSWIPRPIELGAGRSAVPAFTCFAALHLHESLCVARSGKCENLRNSSMCSAGSIASWLQLGYHVNFSRQSRGCAGSSSKSTYTINNQPSGHRMDVRVQVGCNGEYGDRRTNSMDGVFRKDEAQETFGALPGLRRQEAYFKDQRAGA